MTTSYNVFGRFTRSRLYSNDYIAVEGDDRDLSKALMDAIQFLPKPAYFKAKAKANKILIPQELQSVKAGCFCEWGGKIYVRGQYELELMLENNDLIRDFWQLREALDFVLELQKYPDSSELDLARDRLNREYDRFVSDYGWLNSPFNLSVFESDCTYYAVRALEVKQGADNPRKAVIFHQRTFKPKADYTNVTSGVDILAQCLDATGKADVFWMARSTGKDLTEVVSLVEGLVFYDGDEPPENILDTASGDWLTRDAFVSGNVRHRLQKFESWKEKTIPAWLNIDLYVELLKENQPLLVLPETKDVEIKAYCATALGIDIEKLPPERQRLLLNNTLRLSFSASFIPDEIVEQFMEHLFGAGKARVRRMKVANRIFVAVAATIEMKNSENSRVVYGCPQYNGVELIECALNFKEPTVYVKTTLDRKATSNAKAQRNKITAEFSKWVWADSERALLLTKIYNDTQNLYVRRKYDGSHLTFDGSSPEIRLRQHQVNAVWRIMQEKATLLGHKVGAGKTLIMAAASMKLRELGLANKPVIAVLKSTVPQVEQQFRDLYPHANLLVASEDSFNKHNRRVFLSQIAMGDYDAIILSHEQFFSIPVSPDRLQEYLLEELNEVKDLLQKEEVRNNRNLLKRLMRFEAGLKNRYLKAMSSPRKDNILTFEQSGIDAVFFDESQKVKNLHFYTQLANIAGISNVHADRSQDMYIKAQYLIANNKRVIFSTGTPISNSIVEMFTLQRMLQSKVLERLGINAFDAWQSNFAEATETIEVTGYGKYKSKNRFRNFINLPELMNLYWQVADVQTSQSLGSVLDVPDAELITIGQPPSDEQIAYMLHLAERAERVNQVLPEVDNMLKITGDGRKACISTLMVCSQAKNWLRSKINACAWNVWQIWQASRSVSGVQAIFSDLGTPKPSNRWTLYRYLRDVLIALGIPAEQIAFIHDYDSKAKKRKLFDALNDGKMRIVFGSTEKLGTGCNIQQRLVAAHHLDAPWTCMAIEQREGRLIRQGNAWKKVYVFRYVTQGTASSNGFDAFLWQTLEFKANFIAQVSQSESVGRVVEDMTSAALSYAQVKAIATGDPIILRQAELQQKIEMLNQTYQHYEEQQFRLKMTIASLETKLEFLPKIQSRIEEDIATVAANPNFDILIAEGKKIKGKAKIDKYISEAVKSAERTLVNGQWLYIGKYAGLQVRLTYSVGNRVSAYLGSERNYNSYRFKIYEGSITDSMQQTAQNIALGLKDHQDDLVKSQEQIESLRLEMAKPFEQMAELIEIRNELDGIDAHINNYEKDAIDADNAVENEQEEDFIDGDVVVNQTSRAVDDDDDSEESGMAALRELWDSDSEAAIYEPPDESIIAGIRTSQLSDWLEDLDKYSDWLGDIEIACKSFKPIQRSVDKVIAMNRKKLITPLFVVPSEPPIKKIQGKKVTILNLD